MKWAFTLIVMSGLALSVSACARQSLHPEFGAQLKTVFAAQTRVQDARLYPLNGTEAEIIMQGHSTRMKNGTANGRSSRRPARQSLGAHVTSGISLGR